MITIEQLKDVKERTDALLLSMTSPLNLPAPGRCQAVYWIFRFGTALCFC